MHPGLGDDMGCYYLGEYYSEGEYVCQGKDKYVCFENRWILALENAPECMLWVHVAGVSVVATTGYPEGWTEVTEVNAMATVGYPAGWIKVAEVNVVVSPPVPPVCVTDADCPAGYICVNGKCVKKPIPPPSEVPWGWIAAGAAGVGGALLLTEKKKPTK